MFCAQCGPLNTPLCLKSAPLRRHLPLSTHLIHPPWTGRELGISDHVPVLCLAPVPLPHTGPGPSTRATVSVTIRYHRAYPRAPTGWRGSECTTHAKWRDCKIIPTSAAVPSHRFPSHCRSVALKLDLVIPGRARLHLCCETAQQLAEE